MIKDLLNYVVSQENKTEVRKSVELVIKEAKDNGYKASARGIDLFLDNCGDSLPENATQYYRFAVATNTDLLEE